MAKPPSLLPFPLIPLQSGQYPPRHREGQQFWVNRYQPNILPVARWTFTPRQLHVIAIDTGAHHFIALTAHPFKATKDTMGIGETMTAEEMPFPSWARLAWSLEFDHAKRQMLLHQSYVGSGRPPRVEIVGLLLERTYAPPANPSARAAGAVSI